MDINLFLNNLIEKIDIEIYNIQNAYEYKSKEMKILNKIISEIDLKNIENSDTIKVSDLLLCSIIVEDRYENLDEVIDLYEKLKNYLDNLSPRELLGIIVFAKEIKKEFGDVDNTINLLKENFEIEIKYSEKEYNLNDINEKDNQLLDMLKLFVMGDEVIIENIPNIQEINEKKETIRNAFNKNKEKSLFIDYKKLYKTLIEQDFYLNQINKELSKIVDYNYKLEKDNRKNQRRKKEKISTLMKLKQILLASKDKEEITNIKYISSICTDSLKECVLKYISLKNSVYYNALEEEYNYNKENSLINYINLFEKKGVKFKCFAIEEQKELLKIKIDDIEKILSFLEFIKLSLDNNIATIIINTNLKNIESLTNFIKKGILTANFIIENIRILTDETLYNDLILNINLLIDNQINIIGLDGDSLNIYLADPLIIKKNIATCDKLNINIRSRNLKEYRFLSNDELEDKIIYFNSLGFDLNKQLEILNSDNNIIKRIKICLNLNIDIFNDDKIRDEILDKEKFFIPDLKLDEYLIKEKEKILK